MLRLSAAASVLLLAACAGSAKDNSGSLNCSKPAKGYYCVKSGDTLYRISQRFNVKVDQLRAWNNLKNDRIRVGQTLQISRNPAAAAAPKAADSSKLTMQWPVQGSIIRPYSSASKGIDIAAPAGTPVRAAADGVVIYAGEQLAGYGKLLIIRHNESTVTAYGNNDSLLVGEKARVSAGQRIATVGSSGRSDGETALHFEVRVNSKHVDPKNYLK